MYFYTFDLLIHILITLQLISSVEGVWWLLILHLTILFEKIKWRCSNDHFKLPEFSLYFRWADESESVGYDGESRIFNHPFFQVCKSGLLSVEVFSLRLFLISIEENSWWKFGDHFGHTGHSFIASDRVMIKYYILSQSSLSNAFSKSFWLSFTKK